MTPFIVKQERDIPSTRRKQSPRRRDWSPLERTSVVPTGRRLWTRGDEEDKKKPASVSRHLSGLKDGKWE